MKKLLIPFLIFLAILGCEEVINPELPQGDPPLVIDAWLYRKAEPQIISITRANTYFDQSEPTGIEGASVNVIDLSDPTNPISFTEEEPGKYVWNPIDETDSFGTIGRDYLLDIQINGEQFNAISSMNRVPKVDSITWRLEPGNAFFDDAYFGEFWARDIPGDGDTYWIKSWKNGEYLSKPAEIVVAFDAGFSADGNGDGCYFIQPIRDAVNSFDLEDDGSFIPPFQLGDSSYVEINSITPEAFFFLEQVQEQTNRPGGFGELFATPLANTGTNIASENSNEKIVGFFCASAVSGRGRKFTEDAIFEDPEGAVQIGECGSGAN